MTSIIFITTMAISASLVLSADDLHTHKLTVILRPPHPVLSFIDNTTSYEQIMNPTWIEASAGTNGKKGLLARTQNCLSPVGPNEECVYCGGSADKASILTFAEQTNVLGNEFAFVDESKVVFGPHDDTDAWGTEDPRIQYNAADELYYMFYTAYNGEDILLNLATSPNPTSPDQWTRYGPVFPGYENSKSAALLLREKGNHFLYWGDHDIRVTESTDLTHWADIGDIILSPREDYFDSQLVESGPPPMQLSTGDYIFFYNSASLGFPSDPEAAYHVGWVILDKENPKLIIDRSSEPLITPKFAWEIGVEPYSCNVGQVVFLEAAHPMENKKDTFVVYFGGADAVIGTAVVTVEYI